MSISMLPYLKRWITDDENAQLADIEARAIQRCKDQRARNGVCGCRCKNPLEDDGSNTCGCCSTPALEFDPDDYELR